MTYEEKQEKTKEEWRERMKVQYGSYKHKALRGLVSLYYQAQEKRIADANRFRIIIEVAGFSPELEEDVKDHIKPQLQYEKFLAKQIAKEVSSIPIYKEWLKGVKGIGPVLSGCLIGYLQDPEKFATISALHRYCGLSSINGLAQKRHSGQKIDYNPVMKTLMYKIGSSFIKARNPKYREIYDEAHKRYEERGKWTEENPSGNKNKKHLMFRSMKKMERIFMANLWVKWRELEGLPVSDPWVFAIGGHDKSHMVNPD